MEEAINAIAKYMVMKRLINDVVALLAIKEYLLDGSSPSAIAFKYKTSKFKVRGHIQRVIDKAGNYRIATKILERLYPQIMSVEPVMLRSGNRILCTLCNTYVRPSDAESHLRKKHKEFINTVIRNVITGTSIKEF
ncbi:MAG: hypothetical protein QXO98_03180 [Sulfolobales archaeon]